MQLLEILLKIWVAIAIIDTLTSFLIKSELKQRGYTPLWLITTPLWELKKLKLFINKSFTLKILYYFYLIISILFILLIIIIFIIIIYFS
jgi:hypothetical protein